MSKKDVRNCVYIGETNACMFVTKESNADQNEAANLIGR